MNYQGLMQNMEAKQQDRSGFPGFRAEVGSRLGELEKQFPNRAAAAKAAGVAKSTFQDWVHGKRDPSFEGLVRFAQATGVSLEWIAYGKDAEKINTSAATDSNVSTDFDADILRQVVLAVEEELQNRNKQVSPEGKALLIQEIYIHMREHEAEGTRDMRARRALVDWIRRMVTVAS